MAKKSQEEAIWLTQAESDYKDAKLLWENHRYGASVLFYQQAIEKIIKAHIVKYKKVVPKKSHRIEILLDHEFRFIVIPNSFRDLSTCLRNTLAFARDAETSSA